METHRRLVTIFVTPVISLDAKNRSQAVKHGLLQAPPPSRSDHEAVTTPAGSSRLALFVYHGLYLGEAVWRSGLQLQHGFWSGRSGPREAVSQMFATEV